MNNILGDLIKKSKFANVENYTEPIQPGNQQYAKGLNARGR